MDTSINKTLRAKLFFVALLTVLITLVTGPVAADKGLVTAKSTDYNQQLERLINVKKANGAKWNARRSYPYLHKAYKLLDKGDSDGAAAELETYLSKVPDDPTALWRLANIEVTLKRYSSAKQHFGLLAATLPRFGAANLKEAITARKLGNNAAAKSAFVKSVKSNALGHNDEIYALSELAALEITDGDYQKASQYLELLLDYSPKSPALLHRKAIVDTKLGNYRAAAANLERYLRLAPHSEDKQETIESLVFLYSKFEAEQIHKKLRQLQRTYRPAFNQCQLALQSAYIYIKGDYNNEAYATLLQADASQRRCGEQYRNYLETSTSVAVKLKDYKMADRFADQLIRMARTDKEKSQWLAIKGNINYAANHLTQALDTYVRSETLHHDSETVNKASEVAWQLKDYQAITGLSPSQEGIDSNPGQLARVCRAYLEQKQQNNALPCYERLSTLNPNDADYHLVLSEIHNQLGNQDQSIEHAKIAYAINHDPQLGLNIGYMIQAQDKSAAQRWFKQIDLATHSEIAGINVFISLSENKSPEHVIAKGEALLQSPKKFSKDQIILINRKLAYAYQKTGDWPRSANAWIRSFQKSRSADDLMNIVGSNYAAKNYERTRKLLKQINPEKLPQENKPDYYRYAANTYFHYGDYARSEEARKYLVAIEPSAQNWFGLAVVQTEREKYPAAQNALDKALELDPGNRTYLMNQAYIAGNNRNYDQALAILTRLPEQDYDAELNENTAYMSLKAGKPKLAASYFRKALEKHDDHNGKNPQVDMKVLALRDNIRQLESKYRFQAAQVGCFGSQDCQPASGLQETESGYGFGNLRGSYHINPRLAARAALLWSNKNDAIEPLGDSATGAVGFEYKPLDRTNLKLSIDRLIKLGELGQNNTLLRAAWSTNLNEPTHAARRQRYTQFYTEASALLENNKERQFLAESRTGLMMHTDNIDLLNPYLYGQARHQDSEALDYSIAEAGIGISATLNHGNDKFKGDRATSTLFAKTGTELYNSESDKEVRALIGYEFSYQ